MTVLTSPGVAYGGTYGLAMATVLEAVPEKSRGVVAGFTQQGFSSGYLFASGLHLAMSKLTVSPSFDHYSPFRKMATVGALFSGFAPA